MEQGRWPNVQLLAQLHGSWWVGKEQKTEMTEGSWGEWRRREGVMEGEVRGVLEGDDKESIARLL